MGRRVIDLTGQRLGRLVALEPTEKRNGKGSVVWRCLCDCGNECFINSPDLRKGHTRSCGCLVKDVNIIHGMSKTLIYKIWKSMNQRCDNPNNTGYKDYGGRGIKVCKRWRSSFENFYADVGDPPEGKSLDRWPDNDGGYEPKNWRWATSSQQKFNRRATSCGPMKQHWFFAFNLSTGEWDEDNNQAEFAKRHDVNQSCISECLHGKQKIHENWTFEFLPYQA